MAYNKGRLKPYSVLVINERVEEEVKALLIKKVRSKKSEETKVSKEKLIDYLPEFTKELAKQIEEDDKRWGDTWKERPKEGQEMRTKARFDDYFSQFEHAGVHIPWLKIAGGALICWIRENYPDYKD